MTNDQRFQADGAREYEKRIRSLIPGYDVLHAMTSALLASLLADRADILVAGCGTGMEITTLGHQNPAWRLCGIDPSADMLEIARDRVISQGLQNRATLHPGHVGDLPPESRFQAATLILVMHFLPDDGAKLTILQDISSRLLPGAPLILVDLCGEPKSDQARLLMLAWKEYQIQQGHSRQAVEERMAQRIATLHTIPEQRTARLLDEAGFGDMEKFIQHFMLGGFVARKR